MAGGRHSFRIGLPAVASLLVNALLIAALLNLGMGRKVERADEPSLTVMSLAVLKGAEEGAEEAKAAVQQPPAPPAQAAQDAPPAPTVPVRVPVPVALPFTAPRLQATAPVQQAATANIPSAAVAVSAPPAPPVRRGTADGLDVNAPAGTSHSYAARVRSWLYAHKLYPRRARMRREEGVVRVRFVIDRAGLLLEGNVIASSGRTSLDEEAAAMMQRASPFPKAPRDIGGERIEFTAPIEFILPV
ncbi:energy transducer TonB [Sphingobium aromaticiconvertens]|uniref:energy transducer TonB n=1 Tax=Sphingobium aromaticiconvertens TaxID=365341 RepID=UPI00301A68C8